MTDFDIVGMRKYCLDCSKLFYYPFNAKLCPNCQYREDILDDHKRMIEIDKIETGPLPFALYKLNQEAEDMMNGKWPKPEKTHWYTRIINMFRRVDNDT